MEKSKGPGRFQVEDLVYLMLIQLEQPDRGQIEAALASVDRLEELYAGGGIAGDKGQFRVAEVTPTFRLVFRPAGRSVRVVDLLHRGVFEAMGVKVGPAKAGAAAS